MIISFIGIKVASYLLTGIILEVIMEPTVLEPAITFEALKVPLVDDLIALFSKSNEYQQLQLDHALVGSTIENINIWQPFFDNAIKTIHACLATKKHALAAKQKVLTRCFEKIIVEFIDSNYSAFELVGQHDLPGHLRGVHFCV